ncbi:hypothetical protein BS47DRAFT_1369108 [Hydnum rufescens UP504]|uniref:Uncharacterized protein n=1 Tax=Hydnum rufescens UP504 TaxID=1448309 RepID=A0A9P6ADP6_9AGAM|nr:hypothetical protein BS47DRAFT_1369108 [Hydnum rufescens UP504]
MTRPQNEIRKRQGAKQRNQVTPNHRNPTPAITGVGSIKEMMTNLPNKGHKHDLPRNNRQMKPRNGDAQRKAQGPQTNHIPTSIVVQRSPPCNATYECNLPKPQPNKARPPAVHQTKPQCKTTGNADGTTHPPSGFLPSVKTHPTSTQMSPQYVQPPKPRIPSPRTQRSTISRTTHPLRWACGNNLYPLPAQKPPHKKVCDLDPTPATLPNEHGRMTTHLPNESHKWQ